MGWLPFSFFAKSLKVRIVSGNPIRSIFPSRHRFSGSPASKRANLMLDDPPLAMRR